MIKKFYPVTKEAVPLDLSSKSHKELLEMISNYLKSKRYVIVLDDVWSYNLWYDISVSLSDEGKGSWVILTTRMKDVASFNFGVKRHIHQDYPIRRKRLIRLWMAEGFVGKRDRLTVEEVADGYLMDLVCRSMLQVIWRNPSGRPKECKMHDLVREIALSKSETEKFCVVYDGKEDKEESGTGARRLSIQTNGGEFQSWKGMLQQLRSLLVFYDDEISLPRGLRLLKVFDLQDVPIEKLPNELVDLFNLRYLNLKRTKVKELPKSIGRLCNLETLDIRDSKIQVLPTGITRLKKLRHLIMYRYNKHGDGNQFDYVYGTAAPANICKLTNLQVLACVEAESDLMKRVRNMTQLKRIGITKLREADEVDLCIAIQKVNLLHYLFVMVSDENECLQMDKLSSAPPYLKKLILVGKLEKVPRWFHSLQNLTLLYLHWSRLEEDLLPYIQELPSLGKLTLINSREGRQQLCFSIGFPKLRDLHLGNFPQLHEIIIEKGVMPSLQEFWISKCIQLKVKQTTKLRIQLSKSLTSTTIIQTLPFAILRIFHPR
ncbi:disease resistance protein RPM1-like [Camellia sinensis]|uniref:disease resistance protein RPM1-like n=1 Tax=Camellia sinensis TaxID=4442 RepID=UPI00103649E5|nr:disease resistance protein RPM1-like [Camellia sinensis]